ncbi:MAG: AbrB/MazE/SpoVT family DNA-binding domain-containing protein [Gemmatimonadota bacterium]|nr:AbrB/MazE/SpoVT family DNA-binding domain-containing protein [Gemmatimonadota bacterium]
MPKTTRISKWGSSLAVRIPKAFAEEWGVKAGTSVEMTFNSDGIHLRKPKRDLEDMIDAIDPDNLPPYLWDDQPRGNEAW